MKISANFEENKQRKRPGHISRKTSMKTEPSTRFNFVGYIDENVISFIRKKTEDIAQQNNRIVQVRLTGEFEASQEKYEEVENEEEMIGDNLSNFRGNEKEGKESERESAENFNRF